MANSLTKIIGTLVTTPGEPGTPGSPGQPYIPPHWVTRTVWRCLDGVPVYLTTSGPGTGETIVGAPPLPPATWTIIGYTTSCGWATETYLDPGQFYIPPTPPSHGKAPVISYDFNPGWNAGAISALVFTGNVRLDFQAPTSNVGVVIGLSDPAHNTGQTADEIDYAIYLSHGNFRIVEKGVIKTSDTAFISDDILSICRIGDQVTYLQNDSVVYTSLTYSTSEYLLADISMYYGGDTVLNVAESSPSDTPVFHGGSSALLTPLTTTILDGYTEFSAASLRPLTGDSSGSIKSFSYGVLKPLQGLSHYSGYAESCGALCPLSGSAAQFLFTPSYAAAALTFLPLSGVSQGYSGTVGQSAASLVPLAGMSSDHLYAESRGVLHPLKTSSYSFASLGNHLVGKLFKINLSAHAIADFNSLQGRLFKIGLSAYGGGNLHGKIFRLSGNLVGTANPFGRIRGKLYKLNLTASGTVLTVGSLNSLITLSGTLSARGGAIAAGDLFSITGSGSGQVWTVGSLQGKLFRTALSASGSPENFGSLNGQLFSIRSAYSYLDGRLFTIDLGAYGTVGVESNVTFAINLHTGEVTAYTNYHFPFGIVRFEGKYYGIAEDGIYLLEGETDNGTPIASSFKTQPMDFGSMNYKRIPYAYVNSAADLQVSTYIDRIYSATFQSGVDKKRVKMARGVRSRYWQIQIDNVNGNSFKLDGIDLLVEKLSRKAGG